MPEDERMKLANLLARPGHDRSDPVVFAGRREELEWLESMLDRAKAGGAGLSCVIHGIPGSGKTSLVRQFCKLAERNGAVAVPARGASFVRPDNLAADIASRFRRRASDDLARQEEQPLVVPDPGRDPRLPLRRHLDDIGFPRGTPIVVFVDEAQNLTDAAKPLADELHGGVDGRPILPVYAGVSPAARQVEHLCGGAGRLARGAVRLLGPMTTEEAAQSIAGVCDLLAVDRAIAGGLAKALAELTHGFPVHICSAVTAVAAVVVENGGTFPAGATERCLLLAKEDRGTYYEERLDSADRPPLVLLAALARANGSMDRWVPLAAAEEEYARAAQTLPEDQRMHMADLAEACGYFGVLRTRRTEPGAMLEFQFCTPAMAEHVIERLRGHEPNGD